MHTDAIFCTDVIVSLPPDYIGTKGIIHPDDLAYVKEKLHSLPSDEPIDLEFRMITSYGEIKTLRGKDCSETEVDELIIRDPEKELYEKAAREKELEKSSDAYHNLKGVSDQAEIITKTGKWFNNTNTNETYYSDNIFRIHALNPQSLSHAALPVNRFDPQEAAHRPPHRPRLQGRGHLLRGGGEYAGVQPGVQHRLPPKAADAGAEGGACGRVASGSERTAGAAAPPPEDADHAGGGRPGHRPRAAVHQRRRDHVAVPADEAAGGTVPQRTRRRDRVRPQGERSAAHALRGAALQTVRLRRHPPLHDVPVRV